ncbi:pentapeptide repeat-containing protein [Phormidium sp. CLA17]|uniref:pentapeptide repeat-containing protein n=1 Tax=Leptolyngbya sp. Cla-17 TaxID=2803751 RepID=UPI0019344113|nr:pentapeptide repeat-containing protein [Leptolyngbya sp. Cla-17]MBM0743640.1 pentapeptide repeat-containing protein [Leptolyngbya sp. Cla-17]
MHSRSRSYTNQDLRNQSFRGQSLNGADFSGADLRGCDFSGAELIGANFERMKTGQTARQQVIWMGIAIAVFLISGHAMSLLGSGALGQTPSDRGWGYVLALYISLCAAGIISGLRIVWPPRSRANHWALVLSAMIAAAVSGFYYAGIAMEKNPQWAIAGAVVSSVFTGLVLNRWRGISGAIAATMAGTVMGYGAAFLTGAMAIGFLSTQHFAGGLLLGCLTLVLIWLTLQSLKLTWHQIHQAPGTLFRCANLTNAQFDGASLIHTDFSKAQRS